jgi:hypothetical protein
MLRAVDGSNRLSSLPAVRVPPRKMRSGLFHDLLDARQHFVELPAQSSQHQLLQRALPSLHTWTISTKKCFACPTTPAGCVQQVAIVLAQLILPHRASGSHTRPISKSRSFTARVRSRNPVPAPDMAVIFFMMGSAPAYRSPR